MRSLTCSVCFTLFSARSFFHCTEENRHVDTTSEMTGMLMTTNPLWWMGKFEEKARALDETLMDKLISTFSPIGFSLVATQTAQILGGRDDLNQAEDAQKNVGPG